MSLTPIADNMPRLLTNSVHRALYMLARYERNDRSINNGQIFNAIKE
jgi:hypothetical protein